MRRRQVGGTKALRCPAVDPARHQDASGKSGGGGNLNTPGNGLHARESSRSPREKQGKMEDDGLL